MSKAKKSLPPLPDGIEIGKHVIFYLNGWRHGTLIEVKGKLLGVQPVGTYEHAKKHIKWVGFDDVKKVDSESK